MLLIYLTEEFKNLKETDLQYPWVLRECKKVSKRVIIEEKIKLESYIVDILDDAAYAERFISKPHNKNCPSCIGF